MQNNSLQTHIETLYVCFLPSQVSQIRPLITSHQDVIEAQYPIQDKLEPYCIHEVTTTFLFIPIKNMKTLNIQDVIDLAVQIEQLEIPHQKLKTYDIHLALLQKYLIPEHVAIIETTIRNQFEKTQNQLLDTMKLKSLSQSVVERTLCLIQGKDVEMYEYIPERAEKLLLIISHIEEVNHAIINALLDSNIGVVYIVYQHKNQNSREWIAMNGLRVTTHLDNYYNILFDALNYAKQYRMKVMVLNWKIDCAEKRMIHIQHDQTNVIETLVSEQFDVQYTFQRSVPLENNVDLNDIQEEIPSMVSPNALFVTMQHYPDNQSIYLYIFRKLVESLDESK